MGAPRVSPALLALPVLITACDGGVDPFLIEEGVGESLAAHRNWIEALPPDYPHRLEAKVLQSADGLFRASRITHERDP